MSVTTELAQVGMPGKINPVPRPVPPDRQQTMAAVDKTGLEAALREQIAGEVRFGEGDRALYATDGSNYRQVPIGVVLPRSQDDVLRTVALCRQFGAPLLSRGGGTSLAGQCCNVAVVMDFSKYMNGIVSLDPDSKRARVRPGCVLDNLRDAAERHHLTFGPDPATHTHCTLGGMIGNNSCGVHALMAGKTVENVHALDVVTYRGLRLRVGQTSDEELQAILREGGLRGDIYGKLLGLRDRYADLIRARYPKIPRRVSGYNLDQLLPENGFHVARALVGSESTCVTVLEAELRLVPSPPFRTLLVLGYEDVYTAADHVMEVLTRGPIGLEGLDDRLVNDMKKKGLHPENAKLLPAGAGWLLVEFGGDTREEADAKAGAALTHMKLRGGQPSAKIYDDRAEEKLVWQIRESGLGATANVPGQKLTWEGWEDSAVPPERLGLYLRDLRKLLDQHSYNGDLYGHFGQGCVHTRIDFDLATAEGIRTFRHFVESAADLVVHYGGSLSGEHGDGQSRAELLPKMFGEELVAAFREFKSIWDPDWKMNPGKVVSPYRLDENLRLGTDYHPAQPKTHFRYQDDHGSFARAALRCVGVGKCRRNDLKEGGTMCPSYLVTLEEEHSTRGRARLLFEMLEGDVLKGGWREEAVHDALDLCLACKGCKGDCPVNVDMATYKAEFLSHYYKGRLRPLAGYSMGLIPWWARLASQAPGLANFLTQTPGLSQVMKAAGGIAQKRRMPRFAEQSFKDWFRRRDKPTMATGARGSVLLWADTFNNYFHPEVAKAAVAVLESAGYTVQVAQQPLCCGRPLYDFGMLDLAKRLLERTIEALRPQIEAGVPVVGLEPSCVAVFRDEMGNLMPDDEDAKRLGQQTFMLGEFLKKKATGWQPPRLQRKAVVHQHCHDKAVLKPAPDCEKQLLGEMGLSAQVLNSGCCGMAGSFGFEREHADIASRIGEQVLLPAVRRTPKDALVIADGFSCREQIAQNTDRRALHLAQVLRMGLDEQGGVGAPEGDYPERHYPDSKPVSLPWRTARNVALFGGAALLTGGVVAFSRGLLGRRRRGHFGWRR